MTLPHRPVSKPKTAALPPAAETPTVAAVAALSGVEEADQMAALHLDPAIQGAMTALAFTTAQSRAELDTDAVIAEMDRQAVGVVAGSLARAEKILTTQAHALDAIFGSLARRSSLCLDSDFGMENADTLLRLALKAQSQCRATLETLVLVKNPPSVAFVRQANIANGPQQVNNGTAAGQAPRTRKKIQVKRTIALESLDAKRMDGRALRAPGKKDQEVEAVATVDRTTH